MKIASEPISSSMGHRVRPECVWRAGPRERYLWAGCAPRVRTALWRIRCLPQTCQRAGARHPGGVLRWDGSPVYSSITMDDEPTTQHWLRAAIVLRRVADAEDRFSASMSLNEVAMLAAADELWAATRDATAWVAANVCPVMELEGRVALMLNTCAEVALTAQQAITDSADIEAIIGRLRGLLAVVDFPSQTLR
jgi:hypothetical protein